MSAATTATTDPDVVIKCVHESFHEQAVKTPNAVCLIDAPATAEEQQEGSTTDTFLSYKEVQRRVIRLANELRQAGTSSKKNSVVAIFMEPSVDYVISMLAILTAGAAYVPLETAYPTAMLQRVLSDATPVAVITKMGQRPLLPDTHSQGIAIFCLDDASHHTNDDKSDEQLLQLYSSWPKPDLDDLAFVVYSSGTTGQPKGISNPHRACALSYDWRFREICDYKAGDVVAANVFFVWEALRPLMRGGAVVPIPPSVVFDGDSLTQFLHRHQVTEMLFTPSLLENLFNTMSLVDVQQRLAPSLKTVFLNGEVVSLVLRSRCYRFLPNVRFINLYSVSECHEVGAVDLKDIDLKLSTKYCPIGKPCSVSPVYILDENEQPVAKGDAGELYVGGDMLAIGYLNLPELSATRFVPDPFSRPGNGKGRMYRTGDRARFLDNGHLEILGRCDFMVKIRGYSIVLGAVEAALVEAVALSSSVVVAVGEETEDKQLVAYLVRAAPDEKETRLVDWSVDTRTGCCPEIRRAVDGKLPHYMVPRMFIEVETLPVSGVGQKLDRKALEHQSEDRRALLRSLTLSSETHTVPPHAGAAGAVAASQTAPDVAARWKRVAKYLRIPPGSPMEDVEAAMMTLWELVLDHDPGSLQVTSDFQESGGHSLSAARLITMVNRIFSVRFSPARLMRAVTVRQLSEAVLVSWNSTTMMAANSTTESSSTCARKEENHQTCVSTAPAAVVLETRVQEEKKDDEYFSGLSAMAEVEAMAKEEGKKAGEAIFNEVRSTSLPKDVVVKTSQHTLTLKDCKTVLLTGSTGFFGAHILVEILKQYPSTTVKCLVRSSDIDVVKNNLETYKLWDSSFSSQIDILKGDLSKPRLGLSDAVWNDLTSKVDAIVHSGAAVSLTAPFDKLKPVNVDGTVEIIRLAGVCKPGTSLIYVSSNGIFPTNKGPEEVFMESKDTSALLDGLDASDGYGLSKWLAEKLIFDAGKQGLPAVVIRFGNLGWSTSTGIGNPLDYQSMVINGCRSINARPNVARFQFEVTPVDVAAAALVGIGSKSEHFKDVGVYNCVQSDFVDADSVFGWVSDADGMSIPALPFNEWVSKIEDINTDDTNSTAVASLQAFVLGLSDGEKYLSEKAHVDCSKFDAAIAALDTPLERLAPGDNAYYYRNFALENPGARVVVPERVRAFLPVAVDPNVAASVKPSGPLAGQVAVVTGGSSGIGKGIVKALVRAGCNVAIGSRRISALEETQKELSECFPGSPVKTLIVPTDVTKKEDVVALVKATDASLGPVDIMVNNAGIMYFTLMRNVMWDQWDSQVDINCKGAMYGVGAVLPSMLHRGKGHIVNITSDAGRKSFPGLAAYSGSKFFVEAMSQALRAETASTGLRVTCIQPGNVETALLAKSTDPDGMKEYGTPSGAKVLEPDDIGRAVVYAVSQPEWCAVNEILVEPREEPA